MANICTNDGQIEFLDNVSSDFKIKVLKKFKEEFAEYSMMDETKTDDVEGLKHFSVGFESKWDVPSHELLKFCKDNNVTIRGVSVEQGCGYFACWVISPLESSIHLA